ncbi:MAG: histidinol-phosphate transaminase, partial [Rhodospirillaceae bacterium]
EAALGPSPKAIEAYAAGARNMHRYPQGPSDDLRAAIADVHQIEDDQIICGAGSDEILCLLCRAFAGPGDEIIHTRHAFVVYSLYAKGVGATPISVPETNLTADVDTILGAVTPQTRLIFLANPNNPTGTYVLANELVRLRKELRDDILLVVDGAYAEFVEDENYESGISLARATPNTVATRSFSKIYGLAALRLGWAYGPKDIIGALERIRSPFNVATPAQLAGIAAVRDQDHIAKARAHNKKWVGVAIQRLRGMGLKVGPSSGNFVLPEFPSIEGRSAADADLYLQSKGIVVRRMNGDGLPTHLRLTIGDDAEMEWVLETLASFMERAGG